VNRQLRGWATLALTLQFDAPDATVGNYVVALQDHAPVWLGVELPPEVRLVVSVEGEPSESARAAASRWDAANTEGFATRRQLEFLRQQASRAGWREAVSSDSGRRALG
jgi:hypothetical protein